MRPGGRARRHRGRLALAGPLWANAIAIGLLAWALLARGGPDQGQHEPIDLPALLPAAYAQPNLAGGAGLYLMPAQLATNIWGVYLMDVDRQSLMVYHYDPAARKLNFVAAREVTHDRLLGNFNTFPDPLEIKTIAEKERQTERLPDGNANP